MKDKIKNILKELHEILIAGGESYYAKIIKEHINAKENKLWEFLTSNILWGGAGSIADQAIMNNKELRSLLEETLMKLGKEQIKNNKTNVRTETWVAAFEEWNKKDI